MTGKPLPDLFRADNPYAVGDAGNVTPPNFPEIDLSLLDHNLSLSFEERLTEHQSALNLLLDLQEAGERLRAREDEARS